MKTWLSTSEAGEHLNRSARWVREQIEEGNLRARSFTGGIRPSYRIHIDDLKAFERENFRWTTDE